MSTSSSARIRRVYIAAAAFVIVFFIAMAPTLSWPQFSGDSEDLVVGTTLEMVNGGPWWVPTLGGVPRTRKPPLPAWISAASVSAATVQGLPSTHPSIRENAYVRLAWEERWPALVAGCLMLLATSWLAEMIGGPAHVLPAVMIGATSLLTLRFVRSATTDIYLAAFVTIANAFLARAALRGKLRWVDCIGAGISIGLAMMSKGPVSLVFTVVPLLLYLWLRKCTLKTQPTGGLITAPATIAILMGVIAFLAIATPWFIITAVKQPATLQIWIDQLRRKDTAAVSHDPWYGYTALVPNLLPWIPLYLAGIFIATQSLVRRDSKSSLLEHTDGHRDNAPSVKFAPGRADAARRRLRFNRMGLGLTWVFVPIVILSFFHDRKERYLLPLVGPAAVLAAHGMVRLKRVFPLKKLDAKMVWGPNVD